MNLAETAELLALAAAYDGRTVTATDVHAWHALLQGTDPGQGKAAVGAHYSRHTWRLMPAHVLQLVAEARSVPPLLSDAWEYPPGVVGDPAAEKAHRATRGLSW